MPFARKAVAPVLVLMLAALMSVVFPDRPAAAASSYGATPPPPPSAAPSAPAALSTKDQSFLAAAAETNLAELDMARIALQRSETTAVRDVATMIIADHTLAQTNLEKVAAPLGFPLPAQPNPAQLAQAAQLRSVAAAAFDTTYLQMQVNDHTAAITATQAEIADGTNAAVVGYAKATIAVLQKHLRAASRAEQSRGVAAEGPQPASVTLDPNEPAAVSTVVTAGPLAHGAKSTGSTDVPWLIALGAVIAIALAAGLGWLKHSAGPNH